MSNNRNSIGMVGITCQLLFIMCALPTIASSCAPSHPIPFHLVTSPPSSSPFARLITLKIQWRLFPLPKPIRYMPTEIVCVCTAIINTTPTSRTLRVCSVAIISHNKLVFLCKSLLAIMNYQPTVSRTVLRLGQYNVRPWGGTATVANRDSHPLSHGWWRTHIRIVFALWGVCVSVSGSALDDDGYWICR